MSFYNSSIETVEVQANSHTNNRTEFKLGNRDAVYLSNMRLCRIGAVFSAGGQGINRLAGVYSCIRRIELLDGNVSLDVLNDFNYWAGFRQYNRTNDYNISSAGELSKNVMGFLPLTAPNGYAGGNLDAYPLESPSDGQGWGNTEAVTPKAWLSLKDVLAVCDELDYFSTRTFNNLRLVVEWETNPLILSPGTTETISSVIRPYLMVDEVVDDNVKMQMARSFRGGLYRPIESTQLFSPAITSDSSESYTLTGFNQKTINRMIIMKNPQSSDAILSTSYGILSSKQLGEVGDANGQNITSRQQWQLQVSGANLLPGNGYDSEAQIMAGLSDSWGDCNSVWLNPRVGESRVNDIVTDAANRVGWTSYINFDVNQYVKQLVLKVNRPYLASTYYSDALQLRCFAEVNKAIIVNPDGTYTVRYV
jgi:hypothetical protein